MVTLVNGEIYYFLYDCIELGKNATVFKLRQHDTYLWGLE